MKTRYYKEEREEARMKTRYPVRRVTAAMIAVMPVFSLFVSCEKTEEPETYFTAEPTEMLSVDDCGFNKSLLEEILDLHGVAVTVGEDVFTFDDVRTPEKTAEEETGAFLLNAYAEGVTDITSPRDESDDWIPEGDAAREIASLIPASFSEETKDSSWAVSCGTGIQIERRLPDGGREFYFARPDGYIVRPADPSEYAGGEIEYLAFADLPSGFRYASFPKESFARLAAWEAAFSRKSFEREVDFGAYEIPPGDAGGYRLCVSSRDRHLDLSLGQAKEFLKDRLGYEKGDRFTGFALDPAERPASADLIRIAEFHSYGEIVTVCYLAPSGKLFQLREILAAVGRGPGFSVTGLMTVSADKDYSYDAVRDLLTRLGEERG